MNFGQLRSQVEERADDNQESTATIESWINQSYYDVLSREEWPFLLATNTDVTVANQAAYNLPSDFRKSYDLYVDQGGNTPTQYLPAAFDLRNSPALSQKFTIDALNTQYTLHPTPTQAGQTITLTYYAEPDQLNADSDEPVFHARFHEVLINLSLVRYYQRWADPGLTAYHQELAEQFIEEMRRYYFSPRHHNMGMVMKSDYDSTFPHPSDEYISVFG